ncbi:MAG: tetratricopeptide repeat protein [Actinobacteria bacterium]|nr:tetratricopeptide repeat protein [Actinomycetota bacterium]
MVERCLIVRTKLLGSDHIKFAECLWVRALIHKKMCEYEDAIQLYEKALAIVEKQLGSSHPQTALYTKTIADVYRLQSNYTRAESLYRDALYINRSNFGDLHSRYYFFLYLSTTSNIFLTTFSFHCFFFSSLICISVAECLDALGKVLKKVGKYHEAKAFYEEALQILSYVC